MGEGGGVFRVRKVVKPLLRKMPNDPLCRPVQPKVRRMECSDQPVETQVARTQIQRHTLLSLHRLARSNGHAAEAEATAAAAAQCMACCGRQHSAPARPFAPQQRPQHCKMHVASAASSTSSSNQQLAISNQPPEISLPPAAGRQLFGPHCCWLPLPPTPAGGGRLLPGQAAGWRSAAPYPC